MAEGTAAPASGGTPTNIRPLVESPPRGRVTALDLADMTLERFSQEGQALPGKKAARAAEKPAPKPAEPAPKPEPEWIKPKPLPDDEEGDEALPDAAQDASEDDAEPAAAPDKWGTAEEPYTVNDIPEDKFVRVKVDGEETVVSLREAIDGGIRQATMQRRVQKADGIVQQAIALGQELQNRIQLTAQSVRDLFGDPAQTYEYMLENFPQQLEHVAKAYAMHAHRVKNEPGYEARSVQERYEARIRKQQEYQARQQQQAQQQQAQQRARADAEARLKPGWDAGLREAGFPKVTDEMRRMVRTVLQMHEQEAGSITADDVKGAVTRVAAFLNLPKRTDQKPAKPKFELPASARAAQPQRERQKQRTGVNTRHQHATDLLLQGLRR